MVGRVIVGGFMTVIGGLGLVVLAVLTLILVVGLFGVGAGALGAIPLGAAAIGVVGLLIALAIAVVGLVASYYYLSGGIGVLQGKAEGADKGALASSISLTMVGIQLVLAFILIMVASGKEGVSEELVGQAVGWAIGRAVLQSLIPAALLWWCRTAGQNLPR